MTTWSAGPQSCGWVAYTQRAPTTSSRAMTGAQAMLAKCPGGGVGRHRRREVREEDRLTMHEGVVVGRGRHFQLGGRAPERIRQTLALLEAGDAGAPVDGIVGGRGHLWQGAQVGEGVADKRTRVARLGGDLDDAFDDDQMRVGRVAVAARGPFVGRRPGGWMSSLRWPCPSPAARRLHLSARPHSSTLALSALRARTAIEQPSTVAPGGLAAGRLAPLRVSHTIAADQDPPELTSVHGACLCLCHTCRHGGHAQHTHGCRRRPPTAAAPCAAPPPRRGGGPRHRHRRRRRHCRERGRQGDRPAARPPEGRRGRGRPLDPEGASATHRGPPAEDLLRGRLARGLPRDRTGQARRGHHGDEGDAATTLCRHGSATTCRSTGRRGSAPSSQPSTRTSSCS